jgi:hypothetical protein
LQRAILPLWLALSWVEAGIGLKLYLHYYLLIVPPLSLSAAWLLARLGSISILRAAPQGLGKPMGSWLGIVMPAALVLAIGIAYGYRNGGYLAHYIRYATGQESYRDFVLNGWPLDGPTLIALQDLADYMQAHSTPDDRIYVWSDDVQLYYLADRRCAVDLIWPDRLETPVMPGGLASTQRHLLAPTTKFIVVGWDNAPEWLRRGLADDYDLAETIGGRRVYRRADHD